jgi:hypothetical protein
LFGKGRGKLQISIDLLNLITNGEKEELKNVLGCDDDSLKTATEGIAKAAMSEYLEMILGKQFPTRAREIKERRLFHLLKHHFIGRIPSESEVSSIFQLTESESRALLRNVRTRFKFDLKEELVFTVRETLLTATMNNGNYRVIIQSENILEELRQTVAVKAPQLDQISKVKNSAGVYNIPEDTFVVLCDQYEISLDEVEAAATREE